ncbi:MAG: hypothetical protein KBT03_11890 [Bacteroidales bacterium]|nr:hypothetical protein [Candidatus Scybalousia scybalohippi]
MILIKSVNYGSYNTWRDWGLVLVDSETGKPEVKTIYEEAPSIDGDIDSTEVFGEVFYGMLPVSHTFQTRQSIKGTRNSTLFKRIEDAIHGKRMTIQEEGDPYHWTGRTMTEFEFLPDGTLQVTITADCEPYQKNSSGTRKM